MNIVIVGGGTAGWVTALYVKQMYPTFNVTVIESESIGVLGAGEGTTPHFISFLDFVNIPFSSLVSECAATVKSAIKFSGWSDIDKHYYHPFKTRDIVHGNLNESIKENELVSLSFIDIDNNPTVEELACEKGKTTFIPWPNHLDEYKNDKIQEFAALNDWAAHFDARRLARFLSAVAQGRGILRIEGIVTNAELDENGNIDRVQVGEQFIESDILIDATGFAKKFISGIHKSRWVDCSDRLPANRALPFFLEQKQIIPSFTEAIAMNAGWVWKIPTMERFGCGYVFSTEYISETDAHDEIVTEIGFEPQFGKAFSFSAGYHDEIWVHNCLAVGLAAGFVEPLEATSIWQTLMIVERFFGDRRHIFSPNQSMRNVFNKHYSADTEQIIDFLYMHYNTTRTDTEFWKNFSDKHPRSNLVSHLYEVAEYRHLMGSDLPKNNLFSADSYMRIIYGSGRNSHRSISGELSRLNMYEVNKLKNLVENKMKMSSMAIDHREFLDFLLS